MKHGSQCHCMMCTVGKKIGMIRDEHHCENHHDHDKHEHGDKCESCNYDQKDSQ